MLSTVTAAPLRQDRSSEKEKTDLPNDLRRAMNITTRSRLQLTTAATNVYTTIWTSEDMPEGSAWSVEVALVGRGTNARILIDTIALFFREVAGVATIQGAASVAAFGFPAGLSATFATSGNKILLNVTDGGLTTINWDVVVETREVR